MKDKQSYEHGPITDLTPELMEGYVNRTLSPQLMQKVKEFLDKNPFEAEAMEGLKSQSVDLSGELQDLEGRLSRKLSSENNRIRFSWPVAAAVSLLVVSGVLFYFLMPPKSGGSEIAVKQESIGTKTQERLVLVPEIDPRSSSTDDKAPLSLIEKEDEKVIIDVADEEEIEEQIEVNLDIEIASPTAKVESSAPVTSNLADEFEPQKPDFISNSKLQSSQTGALPIDNIVEKQAAIAQKDVTNDNRSEAKKSAAPAATPQIAREYRRSVEMPTAEAPAELKEYLNKNTHYPKAAEANGVQGSVIVAFTVNEKGGLEDFEIVRELGHGCDEEAVKTLRQGPSWKPAEINGIPVKSRGQIEVEFPPQK